MSRTRAFPTIVASQACRRLRHATPPHMRPLHLTMDKSTIKKHFGAKFYIAADLRLVADV
jgi:hypothetical protein